MEKIPTMSREEISDFTYYVDQGNWLEGQPLVTANAPVCKCGCGEPYLYNFDHNWQPYCLYN